MVEHPFRWDFIGLSTDTKPTPATSPKVVNGSTYYTADDSKLYVYCDDDWYEKLPLGGGGGGDTSFTKLTEADYNYDYGNTGSNNIVALWLLDEGNYYTDDENVKITPTSTSNVGAISPNQWKGYSGVFFVGSTDTFGKHIVMVHNRGTGINGQFRTITKFNVDSTSGSSYGYYTALDNSNVKNALDSFETQQPLSANQGRILNGKIGDLTSLSTTVKTDLVAAINEIAQAGGGGGGIKVLTADDYNYDNGNTGSYNTIALWLLDTGIYILPNPNQVNMKGALNGTNYTRFNNAINSESYKVLIKDSYYCWFLKDSSYSDSYLRNYAPVFFCILGSADGSFNAPADREMLTYEQLYNALDSTSSTNALTAAQGKVLKDLIDALDTRVTALGG